MRLLIDSILIALALSGLSCRKEQKSYANAPEINIVLGKTNRERGLRQTKDHHDGTTTVTTVGGTECRQVKRLPGKGAFIYFIIDPTFKGNNLTNVVVSLEYFGAAPGEFDIEYDSTDSRAPVGGAYTPCKHKAKQKATMQWEYATFELPNPRFQNSQFENADFRIRVESPTLFVRRVTLRKSD